MNVPISPNRVTQILLPVILCLTFAGIAGQYYKYFIGDDPTMLKVVNKLDLDGEENCLPTWYQTIALFSCFMLLAAITSAGKAEGDKYARHWKWMALIFLFLSADESVSIHENLDVLGRWFDTRGFLHDIWVIPYLIGIGVVGLAYWKFLKHLPPKISRLFITGGIVFVAGAIGMEVISGYYLDTHQELLIDGENFTYKMLNSLEEFLEMLGIVIFINGSMSYLTRHRSEVEVRAAEQHSGYLR